MNIAATITVTVTGAVLVGLITVLFVSIVLYCCIEERKLSRDYDVEKNDSYGKNIFPPIDCDAGYESIQIKTGQSDAKYISEMQQNKAYEVVITPSIEEAENDHEYENYHDYI
jgi:hypothetical protein